LISSNKSFARRPIVQVAAIPEHRLLLSLSDSFVSVHNLSDSLSTLNGFTIGKSKGALQFVFDLQKVATVTNEFQYPLRLCVLLKRRLLLFYWKNNSFCEFEGCAEIALPDTPRTMAWCKESICIGYKHEYHLIPIGGKSKPLFVVDSRYFEPFVGCLEENRLMLGKGDKTFVFNHDGSPILKYPLSWSGQLIKTVDDLTYLVGLLPNSVIEIKTIEPHINLQVLNDLQRLSSNRFRHLIKCANRKGYLFLSSSSDVIALTAVNYQRQISQLIDSGHFELALKLAELFKDQEGIVGQRANSSDQQIEQIKYLQAFNFFCKKNFSEAIDLYSELKVDPSIIIGLYPELLPEEFRSRLDYPSPVPILSGNELDEAITILVQYLVETRHQLHKSDCSKAQQSPSLDQDDNVGAYEPEFSASPEFNRKKLKQIVDTTLLKCYLQINDALVASLLRLPSNHCHLEEAEKVLKRHHKYSELMILYKCRSLHRKALQLLRKQSQRNDSYVSDPHVRTKEYLQHLGKEHVELIFEYAEWVLREHPDEGLKVFIEDSPETESLPRNVVLEYLERIDSSFTIPYLEHIIYEWKDTDHLLHDTLANKYREKIRLLMEERRSSVDENQSHRIKAGDEPGKLGELRRKLIHFLHFSEFYTAEKLAFFLLNDDLWEERAIVLSKMGNHQEALAIYVYVLKDNLKAEQYCERVYDKSSVSAKDVFLILLRLYLNSIDSARIADLTLPDESRVSSPTLNESKPELDRNNLDLALGLINRHPLQLDPVAILKELPCHIPVQQVGRFLTIVLASMTADKHEAQIRRSLLLTQHLLVQKQKFSIFNCNKVQIDEFTLCTHCGKKIGKR
jgi:tetratricopeptide (TPR) repeat protein